MKLKAEFFPQDREAQLQAGWLITSLENGRALSMDGDGRALVGKNASEAEIREQIEIHQGLKNFALEVVR